MDDIDNYDEALLESEKRLEAFVSQVQNASKDYGVVDKELTQLQIFMRNVEGGKLRGVEYYPKGAFEKIK